MERADPYMSVNRCDCPLDYVVQAVLPEHLLGLLRRPISASPERGLEGGNEYVEEKFLCGVQMSNKHIKIYMTRAKALHEGDERRLKERNVNPGRSAEIVQYLQQTGKTLKEIAGMTDLSESYISRVGKGERNFRFDHLVKLEETLGKPLPQLLVESTKPKFLNRQLRELYKALEETFRISAQLRAKLLKKEGIPTKS